MMPLTRTLTGTLTCLQCGREAATARETADGLRVTVSRPEYGGSVRQLRCPICGGRLWAEEIRGVVEWPPVTAAEMAEPVRRGRPRKGVAS